jgi:hypothetical protein
MKYICETLNFKSKFDPHIQKQNEVLMPTADQTFNLKYLIDVDCKYTGRKTLATVNHVLD